MRILMHIWFLLLLLSCPLEALCQSADSSLSHDEIGLLVLRAVDYAKVQRAVISKDCKRNPQIADRLPACSKIETIPSEIIERLFLPHFNDYVSATEARAALEFWSSEQGSMIDKKILFEIAEGSALPWTSEEKKALEDFNNSEAGKAMMRLSKDIAAARSVIRGIGSYAP